MVLEGPDLSACTCSQDACDAGRAACRILSAPTQPCPAPSLHPLSQPPRSLQPLPFGSCSSMFWHCPAHPFLLSPLVLPVPGPRCLSDAPPCCWMAQLLRSAMSLPHLCPFHSFHPSHKLLGQMPHKCTEAHLLIFIGVLIRNWMVVAWHPRVSYNMKQSAVCRHISQFQIPSFFHSVIQVKFLQPKCFFPMKTRIFASLSYYDSYVK